jgi:prepilin-type N-terminal cleavage/methylation domain-containing protein
MGAVIGMRQKQTGFTIVELLIVIVVIAILAAITIVAYNGIQQRTKNTAIIDAASKAQRMIDAYIVANNNYPYSASNDFACITVAGGCGRNSPAMTPIAEFNSAVATIGTLPQSVPPVSDTRFGITYQYNASRTVDGVSAPAIISYYLPGTNTDCGLSVLNGEGTSLARTATRYSVGNVGSSGITQCILPITGPRV